MKFTLWLFLYVSPIFGAATAEAVPHTVRVIYGIPARIASLNPFSATGIEHYQASSNVIEPLVRIDPRTGEFKPLLAQSWAIDKQHKTVDIQLRPGVQFHNGDILSALDVKFTYEAYHNPEFKGAVWQGMWEDVERMEVLQDLKLRVHFKTLHFDGVRNVLTTLRVLPRSFYKKTSAEKMRTQLIGTGPFQVQRFVPNRSLDLIPFMGWWGRGAGVSQPNFSFQVLSVTDTSLATQMVAKGLLDFWVVPLAESQPLLLNPPNKGVLLNLKSALGQGLWIELNLARPIFQDINVRQALVHLWNRSALNEKLYSGRFELAPDSFSPLTNHYPEGQPMAYKTQLASDLLKKSGWADSDRNGFLDRVEQGQRQNLEFALLVGSQSEERWATLYQQDAARVGVKVNLQRVDDEVRLDQLVRERKYDALAGEGGLGDAVKSSTFGTNGFYNYSNFSDAEVDRWLAQVNREFELSQRQKLNRNLIKKIRASVAQIPGLRSISQHYLTSKKLIVEESEPLRVWLWRIKQ